MTLFPAGAKEDFGGLEGLIGGGIFSRGEELDAQGDARDWVDSLDSGEIFEEALEEVLESAVTDLLVQPEAGDYYGMKLATRAIL